MNARALHSKDSASRLNGPPEATPRRDISIFHVRSGSEFRIYASSHESLRGIGVRVMSSISRYSGALTDRGAESADHRGNGGDRHTTGGHEQSEMALLRRLRLR